MRNAFSNALVKAAKNNPRVVLLTGDHGYALFDDFRRECPDQYFNAGVAEQNMVGVAAGMAKAGYRPVVYGLSAFVPVRVLEQIKLDICYQQLPVILIGDGAGIVYSALGSSHQSTEDIAALRALPDLSILSPADAAEMAACMALSFASERPIYLRMGKSDLGEIHSKLCTVIWGKLLEVQSGTGDIAFLATGSMVQTARKVAEAWPGSAVWSVPSIKPIDEQQVAEIARRHRVLVTLEEHSVLGGLGGAITEIVAKYAPTYVCRIGIQDRFSQFCGSYAYLIEEHGLSVPAIKQKVDSFISAM